MTKAMNNEVNTYKKITKVLEDLTICELEYIKRKLLTFAKEENRAGCLDYMFFESDARDYYEIDEIDDYMRSGIIDFGVYQLHELIIDVLEERKKEYITTTEQFIGIQNKIICWGRNKGISDVRGQFLKVIEEYGEIQKATNSEALLDAFGDTLVTLMILNDIIQSDKKDDTERKMLSITSKDLEKFYEYKDCYSQNIDTAKDIMLSIYGQNISHFSNIADGIVKMQKSDTQKYYEKLHLEISNITKNVILLAFIHNIDFIGSLNFAYNTIAKRTGKTVDGVFIILGEKTPTSRNERE